MEITYLNLIAKWSLKMMIANTQKTSAANPIMAMRKFHKIWAKEVKDLAGIKSHHSNEDKNERRNWHMPETKLEIKVITHTHSYIYTYVYMKTLL